jgi:hypothetical protein
MDLASNYRSLKAFRIGSHYQVMFGPVARGASLALIEPWQSLARWI